jgi:transcriptional regulator with XRE-family HTH domain
MSKSSYRRAPQPFVRLGEKLREMREGRGLPLRKVAEAAGMDLTHLQKIELGQRMPTEEQTTELAKFFKLDVREAQATRIAEKVRNEYAEDPALFQAISMLAEEAGIYAVQGKPSDSTSKSDKSS